MDQQEVLVHVTAPSCLRDDRRYQYLADELARFQIAAVTRVYGFVGLASEGSNISAPAKSGLSFHESNMTKPASSTRPPTGDEVAANLRVDVLITATPTVSDQMRPDPSRDLAAGVIRPGRLIDSPIRDTPVNHTDPGKSLKVGVSGKSLVKAKWLGQWQVVQDQDSSKIIRSRHVSKNPPFKNPFHGTKTSDFTAQSPRTPKLIRPRTAPADATGTIQVPQTLSNARKRSASDSVVEGSFLTSSTISDSQLAESSIFRRSQGSEGATFRKRATTERPRDPFRPTEASSYLQPSKRRRLAKLGDEDSAIMDEFGDADEVYAKPGTEPVECTFEQNCLVRPPPGCKGPFFLRDRSEDWTSPPEPSATDSSSSAVSSTLSLSQPLALRLSQTRISPPTSTRPHRAVDLTVESQQIVETEEQDLHGRRLPSPSWPQSRSSPKLPSDPFEASPGSATRSFYHNSSPPLRAARSQDGRPSGNASSNPSGRYDFTSSIKSLPDFIQAPPPPIGSGIFTTHVSSALTTMIARLPLAKHFRPLEVIRDVRVLERGHWMIRVKIASSEDVAEARRRPSKDELLEALQRQMEGVTSTQRDSRYEAWKAAGNDRFELGVPKRCDLWTEEEFLSFWDVLTKYVEDAKAGHCLSVAKDWDDEAVTPGRSTPPTYARIRVYTWGEIVGHMWVALWVLSDKRTAYVPMEWISADGSVVVKMSGNRNKGGSLRPWVSKGSPGGKGSWGLATATGTPPGNQGKYSRLPSS